MFLGPVLMEKEKPEGALFLDGMVPGQLIASRGGTMTRGVTVDVAQAVTTKMEMAGWHLKARRVGT